MSTTPHDSSTPVKPAPDKKMVIKGLKKRTPNTPSTPNSTKTPNSAKSTTPKSGRTPRTPNLSERRTPTLSRQTSAESLYSVHSNQSTPRLTPRVRKKEEFFLIPPDYSHRINYSTEKHYLSFTSPGTINNLSIMVGLPCPLHSEEARMYYFEVQILKQVFDADIGIGMSSKLNFNFKDQLGFSPYSYGYHGKRGLFIHNHKKQVHLRAPFEQGDYVGCGITLPNKHMFFTKNGNLIGKVYGLSIVKPEESEERELFEYKRGTGIIRYTWKGEKHDKAPPDAVSEIYIREKRSKRLSDAIISQYCDRSHPSPNVLYPVIFTSAPAIFDLNFGKQPFKFDTSTLDVNEPIDTPEEVEYDETSITIRPDGKIKNEKLEQLVEAIKIDQITETLSDITVEDINSISEDIDSIGLLHVACGLNNPNTLTIVKNLLERGADISKLTNQGTALHVACQAENKQVLDLLLEEIKRNEKWKDTIHEKHLRQSVVDSLYGRIDLLAPIIHKIGTFGDSTDTPHIDEKRLEKLKEIYQSLTKAGAKANILTAAYFGDLERVKQCIQERQYADQQDKNGYTALYLALEQNNREMMEYLLDHRASIDFDTDVPSPLIIAAMRHQLDLIELLASKGANMNTMYKKHHILEIFIAVKAPAVDGEELPSGEEIKLNTMRTLCKLGSDPSIYYKEVIQKNQNSYPAFYLALAARDLRAFELFCAYSKNIENIEGLNCETLLHMVVLAESHSKAETTVLDTMMNMLLTETKIFINAETDDGDTPLHTAASLGKLDVVKQLIDAGADVHVKNVDHLTPFMTAIINNQYDCAAYLVSKGAMPNSRSNTMKTALHLLFDSHELNRLNPTNKPSPTDRLNLARGLIERLRLNPNLTDDSNKTARDHAVQNELIKFYPQSVSYHHLQ